MSEVRFSWADKEEFMNQNIKEGAELLKKGIGEEYKEISKKAKDHAEKVKEKLDRNGDGRVTFDEIGGSLSEVKDEILEKVPKEAKEAFGKLRPAGEPEKDIPKVETFKEE